MERKNKLYQEFIEAFAQQKRYNKKGQYFGVKFISKNIFRPYYAAFIYNKQQYRIGYFSKEIDAAKAYNKKIIELKLSKELLNEI